jgi:hypothetical protein
MRVHCNLVYRSRYLFILTCLLSTNVLFSQQTNITDYVIFGGQKKTTIPAQTAPLAPGYAVQIGPTNIIQGGSIGSYHLVKSTGNLTLGTNSNPTNIYSGGIIQLVNSNIVTGKITAANQYTLPSPLPAGSTILSVGSSATLGSNSGGNIDVNGSIVIGGGSVLGKVTIPNPLATYTYSGPAPAGGLVRAAPTLPLLPALPDPKTFPAAGSTNISTTKTISPGSYGDIILGGNKTLTLNGPGVYVFKSITNSGTSNNFVFNFKNQSGTIRIYVLGNVDLGKIKASFDSAATSNGPPAIPESRVYLETHGTGISASNPAAFIIANGSSGSASKWVGTVYAPFAAINIGSGTGSTNLTGALWSGTQVNLQSGISMVYAPFTDCDPTIIDAGPDRPLDFSNVTTLRDNLNNATTYSWRTIGGLITGPIDNTGAVIYTRDSIQVSSAGIYILVADSSGNCYARDTVKVTSKLKSLIGSELQSIFDNKTTDNTFFDIKNDSVMIDVIVNTGYKKATYDTLIKPAYGLNPDTLSNGTSTFIITGNFPINHLPKLNFLFVQINHVTPHNFGVTYNSIDITEEDPVLGKVRSAGDTSERSYLVRKGYDLTGEGIKIGIISNSYNTIASSSTDGPLKTYNEADGRSNGDLPDLNKPFAFSKAVKVLKDLPKNPPRSDEGRAMAEVIHDVAPGAELYFHTGSVSAGDFAQGIRKLDSAGCKIIVDDITYTTEPFMQDGVAARAVDTAKKHGVSYFSAAGNFTNWSYEKDYLPGLPPAGFTGSAHNFGGGDIYDSVTFFPADYTIVLQWVDSIHSIGQGGTKNDLDIYLTPKNDGTALFGFNRDNTDGDPIEFISFTTTDTIKTNILIVNNTIGSNPSRIKLIVYRGKKNSFRFNENMTGVVTSTVTGQSNAAGAITIGAARYDKTDSIEYFSSIGGTFVKGQQRFKPDVAGPDGVSTTLKMGILDYNGDSYYDFFGTSAAAPHAAGVAALIMQGRYRFLTGHPATTPPDTIRALLDSTATDMYPSLNLAGTKFDFNSGHGFINADVAMRTYADPTPFEIKLIVPSGTIPGTVPFTLTVTGENFSNSSKVVIVNNDDTSYLTPLTVYTNELTVSINTFSGNPEVLVYTPPRTAFGDGGFSNGLFFFAANVVVKAVSDTITYGQPIPVFNPITPNNTSITINGVLLQDTTLTLDSLGLAGMTLICNATATSNVDDYDITPSIPATNPIPDSLKKKYNYKFIKGNLKIEQLPVSITAHNIDNAIYGEQIPNVEFTYEILNSTGISNPDSLLNVIRIAHQNSLAKDEHGDDILGLVNEQAVTIENDQAVTIENDQAVVIENNVGYVYTFNGDGNLGRLIINSPELAITNNVVTNTNAFELTSDDIANLSFLASEESLNNLRTVNSTQVVDITEESILWFNKNSAQTYMLSSVSGVDRKGLVDINSYSNEQAVVIENDQAVVIENDQAVIIENDQAVTIENDQAVVIENGQTYIIENGVQVPLISHERTAVIVDETEIGGNNGPSPLKSLNVITGLKVGQHFIIPAALPGTLPDSPPGSSFGNNFKVTYIPGILTVKKDTITVTANNVSRYYLDPNPELTVTYTGFAPGENLQTSGITGSPVVSTTITPTTPVGVYPNQIIVTNGTLASSNYAFKFVNGTFTVTTNPCLLIRPPFNNFGSTLNPQTPTSLWVNVAIKISGQLKTDGRYLLFTGGTITLKDIMATDPVTNAPITTKDIPNGMVIADKNVVNASSIYTQYNITSKTWITHVPVGFSSTSDIFISGAIINSSNGFVKKKNNANSSTIVQGFFYSDTIYSDQWTYALATYRPIFDYTAIAGTAGTGKVVAINGPYRAGTPLSSAGTPINTLVNGASGGGGNNYTGSTSSWDNFTACPVPGSTPAVSRVNSLTQEEVQDIPSEGKVQIIPNPATNYIMLSFVPARTGSSDIVLFTIDGQKVFETNNGICESGVKYLKKIDVSKLINGVYIVQLRSTDKITIKKIIINR